MVWCDEREGQSISVRSRAADGAGQSERKHVARLAGGISSLLSQRSVLVMAPSQETRDRPSQTLVSGG